MPGKDLINDMHAPSKIPGAKAVIPARVRDARDFESLSPPEKKIVEAALEEEHREADIPFHVFLFSSIRPDDLPASAWEKHDAGGHGRKIDQLYDIIKRCGYSRRKPVLLFAVPDGDDRAEATVEGGHHRLQAVRDLARDGVISRSFKIPCIICFHFAEKIAADINAGGIQNAVDELENGRSRLAVPGSKSPTLF